MLSRKETAGSHITELQRAGTDAKQVAEEYGAALKECAAIAAQLQEFTEADEKEHAARMAEIQKSHDDRLAKTEAEIKSDIDRLTADARAKDSKNKEIQSKFSFVIGTVTERTSDDLESIHTSRR